MRTRPGIVVLTLLVLACAGGSVHLARAAAAPHRAHAAKPQRQPPGNVFVSPAGRDAGCTRQAPTVQAARPCATFARAYGLARPGDTVVVAAGTYGPQQLVKRPHPSGPRVTFTCPSRRCTVEGDLQLGTGNGLVSGDAPSFLTINGIDVKGRVKTFYNGTSEPKPTHITIENGHVWNTQSSTHLVDLTSLDDVVLRNLEVGPGCCDLDGIEVGIPRVGAPSPSRIRLVHVNVHDIYDSCRLLQAQLPDTSCSGGGFESGCSSCDHVDGLQAFGGLGLTIERSVFDHINTGGKVAQGIFLQSANGGRFSDIRLVGNVLGPTANNDLSISGPGDGTVSGSVLIAHNRVGSNIRLYSRIWTPGTSIRVEGNRAREFATDPTNGCSVSLADGSSYTPLYSGNAFGNHRCHG